MEECNDKLYEDIQYWKKKFQEIAERLCKQDATEALAMGAMKNWMDSKYEITDPVPFRCATCPWYLMHEDRTTFGDDDIKYNVPGMNRPGVFHPSWRRDAPSFEQFPIPYRHGHVERAKEFLERENLLDYQQINELQVHFIHCIMLTYEMIAWQNEHAIARLHDRWEWVEKESYFRALQVIIVSTNRDIERHQLRESIGQQECVGGGIDV